MTYYAYGSWQEEEEEREEQKAASQNPGSEAPVGDSVMLRRHDSRTVPSSTNCIHCTRNYSDRTQQSFGLVMQMEFHGQAGIKCWIQYTEVTSLTEPSQLVCINNANLESKTKTQYSKNTRQIHLCSKHRSYIYRYVTHVYRLGNKVCTAIYLWLQVLKQRWGDNAGPAANIYTNSHNESRDRSVGIAANY